jgi:TPP-dependent pyruvate/acetoin dehydrogenase alpha subunit
MKKPMPAPEAASGVDRANDDIGETMRLRLFRTQVELREAEQRAYDLFLQNLVKGTSHLSLGQEAIAAGFANAMQPRDLSFCTYRGHAHTLARGVPVEKVLGELMQRDNGLMRGKGGSMHLTSVEHGVMGSYAIIGAHLPIACGAALRAQYKGEDDVSVCFFGDGTTNIGAFHEALNFAAIWKLPVIFVCENNQYAMSASAAWSVAGGDPAKRAAGYGIPGVTVDGMDLFAVHAQALEFIERARRGDGPAYLVANTYRFHGHHAGDPLNYREKEEVDRWRLQDPIARVKQVAIDSRAMSEADIADLERRIEAEIEEAVEFAKNSPDPTTDQLMTDIYA